MQCKFHGIHHRYNLYAAHTLWNSDANYTANHFSYAQIMQYSTATKTMQKVLTPLPTNLVNSLNSNLKFFTEPINFTPTVVFSCFLCQPMKHFLSLQF